MLTNLETVSDARSMSMNHDYEAGVALSDPANKTCVKRPQVDKSLWHYFRLAIKPRYIGNQASHIES